MVKMGIVIAVWLLNLSGQLQKSLLRIRIQVKPNYLCVTHNGVLKSVSFFKHCKQRLSIITPDSCNCYQSEWASELRAVLRHHSRLPVFCTGLIKQSLVFIMNRDGNLLHCFCSVLSNWFLECLCSSPNILMLFHFSFKPSSNVLLSIWYASVVGFIQKVAGQVGEGEQTEMVLTDFFHFNELRSIDFMELGCIDLWLQRLLSFIT